MDRGASFGRVTRHLADLAVVRYDRRGYAHSVDEPVSDDLDVHVDDLLDVVGDRPAVVVGHSLGGVIALAAAERRPQVVTAVGAYEAPMPWADWWPRHSAGRVATDAASEGPEAAAERFMRRMVGDRIWERLPSGTKAARRSEGEALLADLRSVRTDPPPYDAATLSVPVVSARGTKGRPHHLEAAERLAAEAPDAELRVIPGADHGAHLTHPRDFADLVRAVVARGGR
jgi:pimeloyl-ACP methyl ester carboxylesterase